jgi:transcriptional regulator with XRE-family HTH domain
MSSPHFPNYLRAYRKRLSLSQDDVAYLLGANSGAKVCRYERFNREPSFHTALAYEAIFCKPGSELFGELYQKIQKDVAKRAAKLARKLENRKSDRRTARKRAALSAIAASQSKNSQ